MYRPADIKWAEFVRSEHEKRGTAWPTPSPTRPHRGHWLTIEAVCVEFSWLTDPKHTFDRTQVSLALESYCLQLAQAQEYVGIVGVNVAAATRVSRISFTSHSPTTLLSF